LRYLHCSQIFFLAAKHFCTPAKLATPQKKRSSVPFAQRVWQIATAEAGGLWSMAVSGAKRNAILYRQYYPGHD
jgi:hypothetical protein